MSFTSFYVISMSFYVISIILFRLLEVLLPFAVKLIAPNKLNRSDGSINVIKENAQKTAIRLVSGLPTLVEELKKRNITAFALDAGGDVDEDDDGSDSSSSSSEEIDYSVFFAADQNDEELVVDTDLWEPRHYAHAQSANALGHVLPDKNEKFTVLGEVIRWSLSMNVKVYCSTFM